MSTMPSWQPDTETKVERTSGTSKTLGVPHGEATDSLKLKEETTCAPLPNATHSHSLIDQSEWKHDLSISYQLL